MYADFIRRVDGLFVGLLSQDEIRDLDECVRLGYAVKSYEGAAGFMGLAKVRATGKAD